MKNTILILFLFSSCFSTLSQTYDFTCGDFDYEADSGGGTFLNVDDSEIDITIEGMANDYCGGPSIVTGINNGLEEGVVHTYVYTFSEPVDVTFSISNVNLDLGVECYYDLLFFLGDPTFTYLNNVMSNGDSLIPLVASGALAYAGVSYENVTTFTFKHGAGGASCNPGFIRISSMKFKRYVNTANLADLQQTKTTLVNNFVQNDLILRGDFETIPELYIADIMGRKLDVHYSIGEDLIIDVSLLPNGQYLLYFEENDALKVERFVVSH